MNRRDALKLLAGLPLLGFLKPEMVEAKALLAKEAELPEYKLVASDEVIYLDGSFLLSPLEPSPDERAYIDAKLQVKTYQKPLSQLLE